MRWRVLLALAVAAWLGGCGPVGPEATGPGARVAFGLGVSAERDPLRAGSEAARQALAGLAGAKPRAVLVFETFAPAERSPLVAGIAAHVSREQILGCSVRGLVAAGVAPGAPTVAAVALGGSDLRVTPVLTDVEKESVTLSGEMLARALPKDAPGGVLILLGDLGAEPMASVLDGVKSVSGGETAVVGAAAALAAAATSAIDTGASRPASSRPFGGLGGEGPSERSAGGVPLRPRPAVYFQSRVVEGAILAVRLDGPIGVTCLSRSSGGVTQTADGVERTAREAARALTEAPDGGGGLGRGAPRLVLAVTSESRRAALADPATEAAALRKALGRDVLLVGIVSPVQVGPPRPGMPALAVDHHLVLCGIGFQP